MWNVTHSGDAQVGDASASLASLASLTSPVALASGDTPGLSARTSAPASELPGGKGERPHAASWSASAAANKRPMDAMPVLVTG
jgi:hypothetical protein